MLNHLGTQDGPPEPSSALVRPTVLGQESDRILSQEEESLVADPRFALTPRAVVRRVTGSREGSGPAPSHVAVR
jgi:hypothetical protein